MFKGYARHGTPLGSYAISAGNMFILNPGQEHGYAQGVRFYMVNIKIMFELFGLWQVRLRKLPGYHLLREEPVLPRAAQAYKTLNQPWSSASAKSLPR